MALKVGGTSVINNSLGLENIASVDATTAASITAAGVSGGGTYDFVASGAISSGDVVSLNSDGTVSASGISNPSSGTAVVFESDTIYDTASAFDSSSNKIVIAYQDSGNSGYGTAVVGTVSGTSISFGTPVVYESASSTRTSAVFDTNSNAVVIAYRDGGNSFYGTAVVGTVSGTSISFGTPVVFESSNVLYPSLTFDSNSNKVVVSYRDVGNSNYGTSAVGTVSGTSISFGTPTVFESATTAWISSTFDSDSNKVVVFYQDFANSRYGTAVVGTVSGTSISFGTPVVFESAETLYIKSCFDSTNLKTVTAYADAGNSFHGTAIVGSVSGTSISFGSASVFQTSSTSAFEAVFDTSAGVVVVPYRDSTNSGFGKVVQGTVSGTSISFSASTTFEAASSDYGSATFDSNSNKVVVSYQDSGNSAYGTSVVIQSGTSNADDWIGISTEAVSDTSTGTITIKYGINEQQTGLTIGTAYYVADDGSLTTTDTGRKIGKAVAADKLLITETNG